MMNKVAETTNNLKISRLYSELTKDRKLDVSKNEIYTELHLKTPFVDIVNKLRNDEIVNDTTYSYELLINYLIHTKYIYNENGNIYFRAIQFSDFFAMLSMFCSGLYCIETSINYATDNRWFNSNPNDDDEEDNILFNVIHTTKTFSFVDLLKFKTNETNTQTHCAVNVPPVIYYRLEPKVAPTVAPTHVVPTVAPTHIVPTVAPTTTVNNCSSINIEVPREFESAKDIINKLANDRKSICSNCVLDGPNFSIDVVNDICNCIDFVKLSEDGCPHIQNAINNPCQCMKELKTHGLNRYRTNAVITEKNEDGSTDRIKYVKSFTQNTRTSYAVNLTKGTCSCPHFKFAGPLTCKHITKLIDNREKYGLIKSDLDTFAAYPPNYFAVSNAILTNSFGINKGQSCFRMIKDPLICECGYIPKNGYCSHITNYLNSYDRTKLTHDELICMLKAIISNMN